MPNRTPKATPDGISLHGEGPRTPEPFIPLNDSKVDGKISGVVLEEDELQHNPDYENIIDNRKSNASTDPEIPPLKADAIQLSDSLTSHRAQDGGTYNTMKLNRYSSNFNLENLVRNTKRSLSMSLEFVDLKYKIVLRKPMTWMRWERQRTIEKHILHGITGSVAPGEVLAMMGPSGSGKTTLLSVLGGRNCRFSKVTGTTTYNHMPLSKQLKRTIGFVPQDDVLYPHLTVGETLTYAALLRLPQTYSKEDKIQRANEVIEDLELYRCRNTVIGGLFLPGISGGERKRVCIGHEILIDPSIMLLDEPTSGLDSSTAVCIVELLRRIAQTGRTLVITIHQPSSKLFHMFDKLALLSEGNLVYFGKATDAMDYFRSIGFHPHMAMNPADFLLDLCNGIAKDVSIPCCLEKAALLQKEEEVVNETKVKARFEAATLQQYLVSCCESQIVCKERSQLLQMLVVNKPSASTSQKREWSSTWWTQFMVLLMRGIKVHRHDYLNPLRCLEVFAISFISGCLWWQSKCNNLDELQDQIGLLFFITTFWCFLPQFTAIFTFPLEAAILAKERAADMYRLSAYFMACSLGELPLELMLPTGFIIVVYFMSHLHMSASAFFLTLLTVYTMVITSQGVGLFVAATLMDVKKATILSSVLVVSFMLAGGFFLQQIPSLISWIKWLSFQNYAYKLMIKIQYTGEQTYNCSTQGGCETVASYLSAGGTPLGGGGKEAVAMLFMIVAYRALAYMALTRMVI